MNNLGDIRDFVLARLNKDQSGGYVSPSDFNDFLAVCNLELYNTKFGLSEQDQPVQYWQKNGQITDDMRPFIVTMGENGVSPLQVVDGYAEFPSDYNNVDSLVWMQPTNGVGKTVNLKPVLIELIENNLFDARETSLRKVADVNHPHATVRNGKIRVAPTVIQTINMTYLATPTAPYFDHNVVNKQVVYLAPGETHDGSVQTVGTPSASIEPVWPKDVWPTLANLIVNYAAEALKNRMALQMSNQKKVTGT